MNKQELKEKYGKKRPPKEWRKTNFLTQMVTTFLGSGMLPKMPGTWGSLAAAMVAYPLALIGVNLNSDIYYSHFTLNIFFFALALFTLIIPLPFVKKAMADTCTKDPGWIVIDEVCGIFMTLAFVSSAEIIEKPWLLILAFAFFRFFDILKPLGIHKVEKFEGALGVMADDFLGGIYAAICLCLFKVVTGL